MPLLGQVTFILSFPELIFWKPLIIFLCVSKHGCTILQYHGDTSLKEMLFSYIRADGGIQESSKTILICTISRIAAAWKPKIQNIGYSYNKVSFINIL